MLKTQITGAKYLSPQTNQMTNLNIAVPADSKDTKFGTSDIMLAKDVAAYYYTKEETDNQIQIAKNSAINIHNEDNTKSIKLDINDTEASSDYDSPVNVSLTDYDYNDGTININAADGFRHTDSTGCHSNLYSGGLDIEDETHITSVYTDVIRMSNNSINGNIEITTNKELTEEEQEDEFSPVDLVLNDGDNSVRINANQGLFLQGCLDNKSQLDKSSLRIYDANCSSYISNGFMEMSEGDNILFDLMARNDECSISFGPYYESKFQISSHINDTEGATITGVKSIAAFSNPSATKVWATDGSTVDLTTKANTSDVLLKKSASGGYYIEENSNALGSHAFAANKYCTSSGNYSFAEGYGKATSSVAHAEGEHTTASGYGSHAEGSYTVASATNSHAEGESTQATQPSTHAEGYHTLAKYTAAHAEGSYTNAVGYSSHAEGTYTEASGFCAHAQGTYNVDNKNAIHSVGIGNNTTRKNAEYIYAKSNENGYDLTDDPKNGYKYLIGVGGYDGISTDNSTYKSVQEVIADLTARIEQLETKVRALEAANTPA